MLHSNVATQKQQHLFTLTIQIASKQQQQCSVVLVEALSRKFQLF